MRAWLAFCCVAAGWGLVSTAADTAQPAPGALHETARLRQPVAMVLAESDGRLYVANRRSGSLSVVDARDGRVTAEVQIGQGLSDLAALEGGKRLLAVDEEAGELLLLSAQDGGVAVEQRLRVSAAPVSVALSDGGERCFVASLWSRRLSFVSLAEGRMKLEKVLDLPFAPRKQLVLPGRDLLVVADAFGGQLGVVDLQRQAIRFVRELPAHNIRGLALSRDGEKLLVSHQILNSLAETSQNDVHWGILMTNVLRWLVLERVLDPQEEILKGSHVHPPGDTATAGGDPSGVQVTSDGTAVLALAGVDEVAVGDESVYSLKRAGVGRRPTEVAVTSDGNRAFVCNTLDDTISVIDVHEVEVTDVIPLGPRPELSLEDRGERLFYDARLSLDGWFSCHSCHTDGHTNGMLADTLDDKSYGVSKRVLTLLGARDTGPWSWAGRMPDLETQIHKSSRETMQGRGLEDDQVAALTAYLKSLPPAPSWSRLVGKVDEAAVERGSKVFHAQGCHKCHRPPTYTSPAAYDVGLEDQLGTRRFNPPSLRGVSQGGPYFHDGRAESLRAVFEEHGHRLTRELSEQDLDDLLEFLRSL